MFKNLGYTDAPLYEKTRDEYDIETERGRERFTELMEILSGNLPVRSGKALDIGCNAGLSSFVLEELGFEVVGIDIQEKAVKRAKELARKQGSKAEFYVMDAKNLEFDENTFDLVALRFFSLKASPFTAGMQQTTQPAFKQESKTILKPKLHTIH